MLNWLSRCLNIFQKSPNYKVQESSQNNEDEGKAMKPSYTITVDPKLETECSFKNEYELLVHAHYRNNVPPYERVTIKGSENERACSLCDKREPEVSFSKEAHIIPASLGNSKYFSLEECDDCNGHYGEEYESELSQMFSLQRTVIGVKGRNLPKIKFHTGETITFNREKNVAEIITKEDGKIAIERKDGEINLSVDMPKYKPYNAILSLLKSAWLLLDTHSRSEFPVLKKLIRKEDPLHPVRFFNMFYPGNGTQYTALKIYRLKNESESLPPLIIEFNFLNRILFWHYPVQGKENREVFPQISFSFHEKKANVKMNGYVIDNPDTEWGGNENLSMKYERIEKFDATEGLPVGLKNYSPLKNPQVDILIRIGPNEIASVMTILRFDHEMEEFVFEGGELGGRLWFSRNKIFNKQEVKFEMNLKIVPLEHAQKTVTFLENVSKTTGTMDVLVSEEVFFVAYDVNFKFDMDFEALRDGIGYFIVLNKEFSLNFRYPSNLSSAEYKDLRTLACAIRFGSFRETSDYQDSFEITCPPDFLKSFEEFSQKEFILDLQVTKSFHILGKKFGPFSYKFSLENPRVHSKETTPDGLCRYTLLAKSFVQTYPTWND